MIAFLIYLKRRFAFLWGLIERVNAFLLGFIYPGVKKGNFTALQEAKSDEFDFTMLAPEDIDALIEMLNGQNEGYLKYFDPHPFDKSTLERMLKNKAYILMKVTPKNQHNIAGYFFLRCFFIGRAFHGLLVDEEYAMRGIGTQMWRISNEICAANNLRMFATVSKDNFASLTSARNGTDVTVKKDLPNDFLLIECKRK